VEFGHGLGESVQHPLGEGGPERGKSKESKNAVPALGKGGRVKKSASGGIRYGGSFD